MSSGLDSISVSELSHSLGTRLSTELASTLVFDHPSIMAIARIFKAEAHQALPRCSFSVHNRTQTGVSGKHVNPFPHLVQETFLQLQATIVVMDAPLMAAGLDSIAATEFAVLLQNRLDVELPSALLFDHPSAR